MSRGHHLVFLNYGVKVPTDEAPELEAADEPERLFIQLYNRVVAGIDLSGREVLEVSSGHGGGARYLAHYKRPRRMLGVDLNEEGVALCREYHHETGLEFRVGNAVDLPLDDCTFDAVISVEASHRYPSFPAFVSEVHRVLRPGGHLMIADLRWQADGLELMRLELEQSGMELLEFEDLTQKVIASLDEYALARRASLGAVVPKPFLGAALDDAAVPGSPVYQGLVNGTVPYVRFLLRKPVT
jgi:SAM-dependent methyltransferase